MDRIKPYTTGATPGRATPQAAIGLGLAGVGLLVLIVAVVTFVQINQPPTPTPTPDLPATGTAIAAATAEAAPKLTAAAQATSRTMSAATADAAATATARAQATTEAAAAVTAAAEAMATASARSTATAVAAAAAAATAAAAPTATAMARAAIIADAVPVFHDTFDTNANDWVLDETSDEYADHIAQIANGKYVHTMTSKQGVWWREYVPHVSVQDFYLRVEATLVETTAGDAVNVSLAFREDEEGNFYRVRFDGNGYYKVYLRQDGEWITLQDWELNEIASVEPGVTNTFALLVRGSEFTIYANGQELTTVSDSALSEAGTISLATGLPEADQSLTVEFDNLVIRQIPTGQTAAEIQATATARVEAAATAEMAATATTVARATTVAGAPIVFEDSFDSNTNAWDVGEDTDEYADEFTQIVDGKYVRALTSKQGVIWWEHVPDLSVQDFYLSVEATLVETSVEEEGEANVSLTFRENDDEDHYRVRFGNDGYYKVYIRQEGEWLTIRDWEFSDAIQLEPGVTNTFALLVQGAEFTFYANGEELGSVSDATLGEAGEIGLAIGVHEADQTLTVEFDNLIIKEIP
jgi:hypothetical protein